MGNFTYDNGQTMIVLPKIIALHKTNYMISKNQNSHILVVYVDKEYVHLHILLRKVFNTFLYLAIILISKLKSLDAISIQFSISNF